ncbi:MAG: hypothetical protein COT61_05235 [Candidatus Portnoybacteria bacterium CG09_land_8_20_14_0_10_44_13]|uniref:Uncharacterized protein n=1 Tax=Candidatus Portnoybacteria bacterium CG09_land_8_20_14_0_10_44_13 TaxID=1974811 RepID=A0A2H0WU89_9BACT|nr:MAG: hypothetical protein COT61_05235 [Candidatus Portnoybacteria bacterium CG09_land_8_20_14_0_10_44_13]
MKTWEKEKDFELRQFVRSALHERVALAKEDLECFEQWEKGKWEKINSNLKFEIVIHGHDSDGDDTTKNYVFNGPIRNAIFSAMDAWDKTRFLCNPPIRSSAYVVTVALPHTRVVVPDIFYAMHIKAWLDQHEGDYFKHELPEWLKEKHVIVAIDPAGKIIDIAIIPLGESGIAAEEKEKELRLKYPEPQFKVHKGLYLNL